jgi:hypothetical protein
MDNIFGGGWEGVDDTLGQLEGRHVDDPNFCYLAFK